ncbi:bifunctional 5,10-methylenetetrahydrofolate dehydrogenase/5,10-methenyltetrahydrofolate cyclohydrolase [Agrococcus casei]|uniref:bifunctional 5,10-methylenetetrahydrofolate dehydrogenase/5,10-methenyltetrahydrofolate cyclohydrolase n=1 Tax=Agrococcus casei TaxID=343512 RepID=UPI003F8F7BCA
MTAQILSGKAIAAEIKAELKDRVDALGGLGVHPKMATLQVGDDPASVAYVNGKHRDAEELGIESVRVDLPSGASTADVRKAIEDFNSARDITGFIIQLPLPVGHNEEAMLELMDPGKDADGLHPFNLGKLVLGVSGQLETPLPATPHGVVQMAQRSGIELAGKHVAVVGRGLTVGRPLGLLLTRRGVDATVVLAHSQTRDLVATVREADVVVAATGRPGLVTADMVKPGAAVFDVGITRGPVGPNGKAKLVGDVDPGVAEVAGFLSPVPGGVGLMTRVMLLHNIVTAAERSTR